MARLYSGYFSISAIPHTARATVLGERKAGDLVNLENDMVGKYVERLLGLSGGRRPGGALTREFLSRYGF